ncbi:hypothetical protein DYU05_15830 [Mucilaginibacter terrenus]|uniref:Uncharacterized protein n=1 Tax=Mucilaginibacter terrenus TaxID=2482727 RepID=A0A3E2NM67_9SPHI|nr:LiaF domain-containing protein [Mucilaginibacter terrenus]RFZ82096.1 hypothetical protein DYU05_15830 [Mucilaginibacter terrenus]
MSNNIDIKPNKANGKVMFGAILLLVGGFLLLKQLGLFFLPDSLDLWPLWLIFWGLVIGARNNWQKTSWLVLTGLGTIFLLTENLHNSSGVVWPLAFIGLGIWIIMRKKHDHTIVKDADYWDRKYRTGPYAEKPLADFGDASTAEGPATDVPPVEPVTGGSVPPPSYDDVLDATAIFGGVNKTIFSKNFRGGDITNIFGGSELDFTHADINGMVYIDITQVFGGTKIIVPANWQVVSDISAIFAGTDDKRIKSMRPINADKVLVLKGVSLFAGVEIRSY